MNFKIQTVVGYMQDKMWAMRGLPYMLPLFCSNTKTVHSQTNDFQETMGHIG